MFLHSPPLNAFLLLLEIFLLLLDTKKVIFNKVSKHGDYNHTQLLNFLEQEKHQHQHHLSNPIMNVN